jgi:hypothetical protein
MGLLGWVYKKHTLLSTKIKGKNKNPELHILQYAVRVVAASCAPLTEGERVLARAGRGNGGREGLGPAGIEGLGQGNTQADEEYCQSENHCANAQASSRHKHSSVKRFIETSGVLVVNVTRDIKSVKDYAAFFFLAKPRGFFGSLRISTARSRLMS